MENLMKTISKGENVLVHIKPNIEESFNITNGINYNLDTLEFKYKEQYANVMITITYSDANGFVKSYSKTLEQGGFMSWMNDDISENTNYGFISFSCRQEVFLDFRFK